MEDFVIFKKPNIFIILYLHTMKLRAGHSTSLVFSLDVNLKHSFFRYTLCDIWIGTRIFFTIKWITTDLSDAWYEVTLVDIGYISSSMESSACLAEMSTSFFHGLFLPHCFTPFRTSFRKTSQADSSNDIINSIFVCFLSHSRIFHSFGDVTIGGERLQILTYARHLWPLISEGSLACHTYCDMGHPFIMVISEDTWHSHLMPSVWQLSCHYLLLRLRSVATGEHFLYATAAVHDLGLSRLGTPHLPPAGRTS